MKSFLEEYGYLIVAVLAGLLVVVFLVWGLGPGGFLEVLARQFSSMTFG